MHGRKRNPEKQSQKQSTNEELLQSRLLRTYKQLLSELSEPASDDRNTLTLTRDLLLINPEHYTAWNRRRHHLIELGDQIVLQDELDLSLQCLKINPKSYWVWNHRRWIMSKYKHADPVWQQELGFCAKLLDVDSRNFHCWDYRRWVLSQNQQLDGKEPSSCTQSQLDFTMKKLSQNFSNYSAWHLRSLMLPKLQTLNSLEEFKMINAAVYTEPADQSAWMYFHWMIGHELDDFKPLCWNQSVSGMVALFFQTPVRPLNAECQVYCDGELVKCCWRDQSGGYLKYGTQWRAMIKCGTILLRVTTDSFQRRGKVVLAEFTQELTQEPTFDVYLSPEKSTILSRESQVIEELLELEPDSKWALLTQARLYLRTNDEISIDLAKDNLEALRNTDPLRKEYYEYVLNGLSTLRRRDIDEEEQYPEEFYRRLSVTSLRRVRSRIQSLQPLCVLTNLTKLELDGNKITHFEDIWPLEHLQELLVQENPIGSLDGLWTIASTLRTLYITPSEDLSTNGLTFLSCLNGKPMVPDQKMIEKSRLMRKACLLSHCSIPSPSAFCVGALIVNIRTNEILSTGYSREIEGNTHAEQVAIEKLKKLSSLEDQELTLYTSMQPCIHRTSGNLSCIDRIIEMKHLIKEVVIGVLEPPNFVSTNGHLGVEKLQSHGLSVTTLKGFQKMAMFANGHLSE